MKKLAFILTSILPFLAFSQADGDTLFDAPMVHEIHFQFYTGDFIDSLMSSHTTDRDVPAMMTIDGVVPNQKKNIEVAAIKGC